MTGLPWRKSSFSSTDSACVEVAPTAGSVLLRNSNHPGAGTLALDPGAMSAWVATVAAGDLDDLAVRQDRAVTRGR